MLFYICAKNVRKHVTSDVRRQLAKRHVCSIVNYVVRNVCVYRREHMDIKKNVLAMITGRPQKVDQNVHNNKKLKIKKIYFLFSLIKIYVFGHAYF